MQQPWWKDGVVYQIWPRSFKDSDSDGIGDLRGIIEKLDYLAWLGVRVVWLSPVYQTPNDDMGYDISDYRRIGAEFGTMADWQELVDGLHARDIRLIMDLVVNHTSDEHPWFRASRRSKENPYRDYYIWRPGRDGREPNNWSSYFSGSAWEYDPATEEYYLHLFSKKQPDLNWENPAVRREIYEMMDWWLQRGVDGFRMDVINMISKVPGLPDAPVVNAWPYQFGGAHFLHGPRLEEFLHEMKREVLARYDTLTVGEMPGVTPAQALAITHEEHGSLDMVFQFDHVDLDVDASLERGKWGRKALDLRALKAVFSRWQTALEDGGWNSLYLANHDQPRSVSRYGDDGPYRVESAKMLATFLHLLRGTPYVYQGEEIGMTNVRFPSIDDYRDIETLNMYREFVDERGYDPDEVMAAIYTVGRDNARTPMQWDATANAGFSAASSWIGLNPNYHEINVARAMADPDSILAYYRRLIELRKAHPIIVHGSYELLYPEHDQIYAYTRTFDDERLLVILNFSAEQPRFDWPEGLSTAAATLMIANYPVNEAEAPRSLTLRPYEARAYHLT